MKKLIQYIRVSTKGQGRSGLGLDAQQTAVEQYRQQVGGKIIATYREVESGKRKDRPELAKALAHAKRSKATLVVAKLDRLARNVAFLSALMESKCDFVACDNPHATPFTIHILAAVAEHEAKMISARTSSALQALKARGVKLGSARKGHWQGREKARLAGSTKGAKVAAEAHRQAANEAYADLYPTVKAMRAEGRTLWQIADALTEQGHTTRSGKAWNASQVSRVLQRAN